MLRCVLFFFLSLIIAVGFADKGDHAIAALDAMIVEAKLRTARMPRPTPTIFPAGAIATSWPPTHTESSSRNSTTIWRHWAKESRLTSARWEAFPLPLFLKSNSGGYGLWFRRICCA